MAEIKREERDRAEGEDGVGEAYAEEPSESDTSGDGPGRTGVVRAGGPPPPPEPPGVTIGDRLDELRGLKEKARLGGGPEAIERQHARGKLAARERLELLLDPDSFVETDMLTRHRLGTFGLDRVRPYTDGVVTGWGTIDGRKVFVYAQDFTIFGGSLGEVMAEKICKIRRSSASTTRAGRGSKRVRRHSPGTATSSTATSATRG